MIPRRLSLWESAVGGENKKPSSTVDGVYQFQILAASHTVGGGCAVRAAQTSCGVRSFELPGHRVGRCRRTARCGPCRSRSVAISRARDTTIGFRTGLTRCGIRRDVSHIDPSCGQSRTKAAVITSGRSLAGGNFNITHQHFGIGTAQNNWCSNYFDRRITAFISVVLLKRR